MSAKKSQKQNSIETITLTPELKKLPGVKEFLKSVEEFNEVNQLDTKLAPVVEKANEVLGKHFKKFSQLAKYVADRTAPTKRLDDGQKKMILDLAAAGKKHKEIAAEVGCKVTQVSTHIFKSKKK